MGELIGIVLLSLTAAVAAGVWAALRRQPRPDQPLGRAADSLPDPAGRPGGPGQTSQRPGSSQLLPGDVAAARLSEVGESADQRPDPLVGGSSDERGAEPSRQPWSGHSDQA